MFAAKSPLSWFALLLVFSVGFVPHGGTSSTAVSRQKVWVHFEARPLSGSALETALAAAQAALHPRAARRRAKVHGPGERLVTVDDLPLDSARLAACEALGVELCHESRWLNAASFWATAAQVKRLGLLSGVRQVAPVRGLHRAGLPTPVSGPQIPWRRRAGKVADKAAPLDYGFNLAAMTQANVVAAHAMGLTGHGVVVGMLDAGFRTTHNALAGIPVLAQWDFVNADGVVDDQPGDPAGSNSHGTMTLSTLAGYEPGQMVAPAFGVSVLLAKTEDISQEVPLEEDNWVAGLEWAEALGADMISSSLGYIDWYTFADLNGNTAVTTIAADLATARGLVVVNSAGNDRLASGHIIAPADGDSVISVGAVDAAGVTTFFSSPGPTFDGRIKPDVAALGLNNNVAWAGNDTLYVNASGTSFSCPLTSGVVALMLERVPSLTPWQVREALRATASQSATPDNDRGWGIINAAAAATWYGPVIAHSPLTAASPQPFQVGAVMTDRVGLDLASPQLHYRLGGGLWQSVPLNPTAQPDSFQAALPVFPSTVLLEYYLTAGSTNGVTTSYPFAGALEPLGLTVNGASPVGDHGLPQVTQLGANVPNPFNPRTAISFTLATAGSVSLHIHDVRGMLVRNLFAGHLDPGTHTVHWDGQDDAGRALSSGTYFYRLDTGGQVLRRKMLLLR